MKILFATLVLLFATPFLIAAQTGATPAPASEAGAKPVKPAPIAKKVKPGKCHTNNDGVTVCNAADSGGDIKITPQTGGANAKTTVDFLNGSSGSVTGIDSNDTVNVSNGAEATISGTGGTVDLSAGSSSGSVTNTGAPGGGNITITGGPVPIQVPPGSTVNFG